MQIFEDGDDLGSVELGLRNGEAVDGAKVGEELSAAHKLQHHVKVAIVLGGAVEVDLQMGAGLVALTMKGWLIELRMQHSDIMWSTCLSRIISAFFRIFIATYFLLWISLARRTRPNEPTRATAPRYLCPGSASPHNPTVSISSAAATLHLSFSFLTYILCLSSFYFTISFTQQL